MTVVDALQGEWLCMIDNRSLHDAWLLIAGDVASIAGVSGRVMPAGHTATIEFADGTALIVTPAAPRSRGLERGPINPMFADWTVEYQEDGNPIADGWLTRPALTMAG